MGSSSEASYIQRLLAQGFCGALCVVVGGRGGIGREVSRQIREFGGRVVCVSSSTGEHSPDLSGLRDGEELIFHADIRQPDHLKRLAQCFSAGPGRIDVLVNTAGSSVQVPLRRIEALTDDVIEDVFRSNALSVLATIRELTPFLKAGRSPVIVNIGSVAARTGQGSNLAYVGAKAAVEAMSIGLAKALAPDVRVVGISPSALDTGFVRGRGPDFIEATIKATPLARLTRLEEVACAVLCAARLLTATTGVSIAVDGGRHL